MAFVVVSCDMFALDAVARLHYNEGMSNSRYTHSVAGVERIVRVFITLAVAAAISAARAGALVMDRVIHTRKAP